MHMVVDFTPALVIFDEDLEFAETVKRRYGCRGYEAHLWSEASELIGKNWDIVLFKHSSSSEDRIKSWVQSRSCQSGIEIIMLAPDDILGRTAEFVPQPVTDVQRLPLNWLELDWRLHKARQRRQRLLSTSPEASRRPSPELLQDTNIDDAVEQSRITGANLPSTSVATLEELQRGHVESILLRENWNKARTARALGVNRRSLYRLIERFGLRQGSAVGQSIDSNSVSTV